MNGNFSNDNMWGMKGIDWECLARNIKQEMDEEELEYILENVESDREFCFHVMTDTHPTFREHMIESYRQYSPDVCKEFEIGEENV